MDKCQGAEGPEPAAGPGTEQQVSSRSGHRHSWKMHGETRIRRETVARGPRAAARVCQVENEQNLNRAGESAPDFI